MSGTITSVNPGCNEFGVPYATIIEERERSHRRLEESMRTALKKWATFDLARGRHASVKTLEQLRADATAATERALG